VGVLAAAVVVSTLSAGAANATLSSVGPVNPSVGFPSFYGDGTGTKLQLCIRAGDPCLAGTTVAGSPSTPGNITPETFYFVADGDPGPLPGLPGSSVKYRAALEASFGTGTPAAGDQITFARINIVGKGLKPNTTYTFTHPYGTATATTDALGQLKFRDQVGCPAPGPGVGPCDFNTASLGAVGPYLKWDPAVGPVAPAGYLGDAVTAHPVLGSPNNTNFLRVDSGGVTQAQTNNFIVAGKLFTPPVTPSVLGGLFKTPQAVALTTGDPLDKILYTTDGTPVGPTSPVYTGPVTIGNPTTTSTTTLSYAVQDGAGNMGATFSQTYTVDPVAPTISSNLADGTYVGPKSVALTAADDSPGAPGIFYTLDGSTPTTGSTKYAGPISLGGTVTLKYIAVDAAGNISPVGVNSYTVNTPGPTSITAKATPTSVASGGSSVLTGKLLDAAGSPLGGAPVSLLQRPAGAAGFTPVASGVTAGDGTVFFPAVTPAKTTDYQVTFAGNAAGMQASGSLAAKVTVSPTVALNLSATNLVIGQSTTFSGAITPVAATAKGGSVQFTIRRNGAVVQTSGTGVNNTTGAYSWTYKPSSTGAYTVQASYTSPDTASYTTGTSSVVNFVVN
jgi:hypothetical protein